jgi:hypothetical protein
MNPFTPVLTLCMGLLVAGIPMYIQGMILKLDSSVDIRKKRLSKSVKSIALGFMCGGTVGIVLTAVVAIIWWRCYISVTP